MEAQVSPFPFDNADWTAARPFLGRSAENGKGNIRREAERVLGLGTSSESPSDSCSLIPTCRFHRSPLSRLALDPAPMQSRPTPRCSHAASDCFASSRARFAYSGLQPFLHTASREVGRTRRAIGDVVSLSSAVTAFASNRYRISGTPCRAQAALSPRATSPAAAPQPATTTRRAGFSSRNSAHHFTRPTPSTALQSLTAPAAGGIEPV
jgi:hypothetical protein